MHLICLLLLAALPMFAGPYTYSLSGTWNPSTDVTPFYAPSTPFSLSFDLNNPPPVFVSDATEAGMFYTNGHYTLNGVPVALDGNELFFFVSASGQSFDICLDSNCVYQINGGFTPFFTGPSSAPVPVTGSLLLSQLNATYFPVGKGVPNIFNIGATTVTVTQAGAPTLPAGVPEPATLGLFCAGLAAIVTRRLWTGCWSGRPTLR